MFDADFEAVLGSRAAAELRLNMGDRFQPQHGVEPGLADDNHAEVHTVVGILRPSGTAFDNAVFTTVASVVRMHAEHVEEEESTAPDPVNAEAAGAALGDHDLAGAGQVTAILIRPTGFIEANQLWQEFYTGTAAQAVFPGRELGSLFDLLNQGQEILIVVGYLAAAMAALTLFLAIYSATESRQQLLAILRGVGASRHTVVLVVLVETVLVALAGALLGRLLGYGTAGLIAAAIARQSAIPIAISYLGNLEVALWLLPLALGLLAGLLPAWQAYRVNVVEKLFPPHERRRSGSSGAGSCAGVVARRLPCLTCCPSANAASWRSSRSSTRAARPGARLHVGDKRRQGDSTLRAAWALGAGKLLGDLVRTVPGRDALPRQPGHPARRSFDGAGGEHARTTTRCCRVCCGA